MRSSRCQVFDYFLGVVTEFWLMSSWSFVRWRISRAVFIASSTLFTTWPARALDWMRTNKIIEKR